MPRRALITPEDPEPRSRIPTVLLATTVVAALVIGVAYLVFGTRDTTAEPTPGVTSTGVSETTAAPSPTPSETTPTAPATVSSAPPSDSAPLPSPNPGTTAPPDDSPPDPTTTGPTEEEPAESASPAGTIELNDTAFVARDGWVLYGDEVVEGDRRVVRLSEPSSDARLQVLTLLQDQDLAVSCEALITAQQDQYTVTSEQLPRPVSVAPAQGTGMSCGFAGVRTSDSVANSVSFILLRRTTDSHVLMLRTTIPATVGVGDQARRDLTAMSCGASTGFGVPLPLC